MNFTDLFLNLHIGAFGAEPVDRDIRTVWKKRIGTKAHQGGSDLRTFRLPYSAATATHQMYVVVAVQFIDRCRVAERQFPENAGVLEKFDSIVDSGSAYVIAVFLNCRMQRIDLEMGIHLVGLAQNREALGSLTQLPLAEKRHQRVLDIIRVVGFAHSANLIQKSDCTK